MRTMSVLSKTRGVAYRAFTAVWKVSTVALAVLLFSTAMSATANAGAAPGTGQFCNTSLSTGERVCFRNELGLRAHRATATDYALVAAYNWINYNQGGGYEVWSGDHACTATYGDRDYAVPDLRNYLYINVNISENNTYSSLSTYTSNPSKCDIQLYDGVGLTGDSSVFISRCAHLANCTAENWYDRASSFVLS